jgi:hypothetical protein
MRTAAIFVAGVICGTIFVTTAAYETMKERISEYHEYARCSVLVDGQKMVIPGNAAACIKASHEPITLTVSIGYK